MYYVSVADLKSNARSVARLGLLAGPFKTHEEALALVNRAREEAEKVDPFAHFYSFGTVNMAPDYTKPGVLNARLIKEA